MSAPRKATIPGMGGPAVRASTPGAPMSPAPEREGPQTSPGSTSESAAVEANGAKRRRSNGYAASRRVAMNHRVREPVAARLAALVEELRESDYPASQAELLQALIHFRLPERDEATRLVERWRALVNAPPER